MNSNTRTKRTKSNVATIAAKIDAERKALEAMRAKCQAKSDLIHKLRDELHVAKLDEMINVPGGVKFCYAQHHDPKIQALIGVPGTLLQIRRTRGTVDFAGETWNVVLGNIVPVTEVADSFTLTFGGGR